MLADRGATRFATTDDAAMTVNQFFKQFYVFVIDVHRTWPFTVHIQRIFANCSGFRFGFSSNNFASYFTQGFITSDVSSDGSRDTLAIVAARLVVGNPAIMQIG